VGAVLRRSTAGSITDDGLLITGSSVMHFSTESLYYDGTRATFWEKSSGVFRARDWNELMPPGLGIHLYGSSVSGDGQYVLFRGPDRQTGTPASVIAKIAYDETGNVAGLDVLEVLLNTNPHDINHDGAGVVRVLGTTEAYYFLWRRAGIDTSLKVAPDAEAMSPIIGKLNNFGQVANT
jgi:hypothetical protein